MAFLFDGGTCLPTNSEADYWDTYPFTWLAWVWIPVSPPPNTRAIYTSTYSSTREWYLGISNTGYVEIDNRYIGTSIKSNKTVPAGMWTMAAAVWESTTSRYVWCNDDYKHSTSTASGSTYQNDAAIGVINTSTRTSYFNGSIAHVAFWNTNLSITDMMQLWNGGLGRDPREVRLDKMIRYWPLDGRRIDLMGVDGAGVGGSSSTEQYSSGFAFETPKLWFPTSSIATTIETAIYAQPEGRL